MPPEFIPLCELLTRGRSRGYPVASGVDGVKSWDDLIGQVSAWQAAFSARAQTRFALHYEDSWTFACALLGAWAAGKHAVIPGDALPATLKRLGLVLIERPVRAPAAIPGRLKRAIPGGALTVYTSGTTGRPAAFAKSFAQLGAEIENLENTFGQSLGAATILSTVSHAHIYGMLFKILWPLCSGRPFHIPSVFYPEEIIAAARRERSCALVSSPSHLKRLPEELDWSAVQDRWRAVFSSANALPFEAAQKVRKLFGLPPFEVYGSSETGGVAWRERTCESSAWKRFPHVQVGLELKSGALRVRSPHLPDRRWFATGDRARLTAEGFELLGRLDRIVKIEGKRVSLAAVEQAILGSGLADEARVITLPAQERLGAVVVPNARGRGLAEKVLQQRLRERLALTVESAAIPKRWRLAAALPRNASGKVTEESLRELFEPPPRWPEILETTRPGESRAAIALRLPRDLFYFQGHFPGIPILPGVVQLDWAVHYGKQELGVRGRFRAIEALKFRKIFTAGDQALLTLAFDKPRGRLKFEYESARGKHSSGTICFEAENA